jgi:hypothetical protein
MDPEANEGDDVNVAAMFDLSQKKKKKKKKPVDGEEGGSEKAAGSSSDKANAGPLVDPDGPPTYSYKQLLQRVSDLLAQNNPELTDRRRPTMKPPQLMKGRFTYLLVSGDGVITEYIQWVPRRRCGPISTRYVRL